jgi:two-component system, sensor histidine kinase
MRLEDARSIRRKLHAILLRGSLVSLLLAGLGMMTFDLVRYATAFRRDMETQADVLALSSQAALSFQDSQAAAETLRTLRARPSIELAALYDARGRLFASYSADDQVSAPAPAPSVGSHTGWRTTDVARPVTAKREGLGFIYIRGEHQMLERLLQYLGVFGVVLLIALGAAIVLTNRLQRSITEPITAITAVARKVLRGETHALRAEKKSNDEVGELVEAFNAMLAELGRRAEGLQESNRAKDRFLATLAHELRNPLAPIRTGLEILRVDRGRTGASERARATMERQLAHMVRLIDDLLDIARVNTGKFALERRSVGLRSLVESAVEACRPALDEKAQALDVAQPPGDLRMYLDPVRITQAITNLLGNAIKYTPRGGHIRLQVAFDSQAVHIIVSDNGIGIARESLPKVFDLFAQVGGEEHSRQGLGIGLFLVRSVVDLHGGSVAADSPGEVQGSTFTVVLPATLIEEVVAASVDSKPADLKASDASRRILVVDDNEDAASTLAALLEMLGHTVGVANSGEKALEAINAFDPHIVVLDIGMPGLDGYEVARRLRARTDLRRRPLLVAATGWGAEADRDRAFAAGFDRHLTKPIEVDALQQIASSLE